MVLCSPSQVPIIGLLEAETSSSPLGCLCPREPNSSALPVFLPCAVGPLVPSFSLLAGFLGHGSAPAWSLPHLTESLPAVSHPSPSPGSLGVLNQGKVHPGACFLSIAEVVFSASGCTQPFLWGVPGFLWVGCGLPRKRAADEGLRVCVGMRPE